MARGAWPRRPTQCGKRQDCLHDSLAKATPASRMHLTTSPADWYAARAAGIVALVLLTAVVTLGVSLADKKRSLPLARFAVEDIHRFLGLLTGTFIAVHVVTIAI